MKKFTYLLSALCTLGLVHNVYAAEQPIGEAQQINGMEVGAVYLQAVKMQPQVSMATQGPGDIHLEADIHALKNNPNGFGVGEWIPYLNISYHLEKVGSDWQQTGSLMPMVASDGPHYGINTTLDGAGKYKLLYHINPPSYNGFFHHVDRETGVANWWKPFDVEWEFVYLGTGKKGGY